MPDEDVFRFDDNPRDLRFRPSNPSSATTLTGEQIEAFNATGYVSPLPGLDPEAATSLRGYIDWLIDEVVSADDRRNSYSINQYHQVCRGMHDLVTTPLFVAYATDILGPEIVLWSSHMFCKLPGDGMEVPLHQDANYWPFSPTKSVTVWLAVDDVDAANSAMRFAPGSHLAGDLAHEEVPLDGSVVLNRRVAGHEGFDDTVVNELAAGQVSLHTDLLLHGSHANNSDRRRCGIALRYIAADVRAVAGGENWITGAVHVADGDPSAYWPNRPRPDGEDPHRMARFVGGFDGNR
jgi:non-haem Fe2+, alpha-ketoglutarate-dependent halogenase